VPEFPEAFSDISRDLNDDDLLMVGDPANPDDPIRAEMQRVKRYVSDVVIWRPTEGSPSGNVYADVTALFAAIATKRGSVTIVCDHALSSTFTITAAAYPLLCAELRFVGWKNSPATVAIADGVTFTGGTIRSIAIDGIRLEWRGTGSPLIPAVTTTLHIDLYRGGVLGADNGNSAVMFEIDEFALVRLHDPLCQIEASNYEIFRIADTNSMQVYLAGFLNTVSGDFARSSGTGADDGAVQLFYDSCQGPTYPAAQTNLGGTYSKTDGVPFSPEIIALKARLNDLEGVVVESGTSINVAADTRHLVLTSTASNIDLTWPDAAATICCRVYAASGESTQTINFFRSAGDTAAGTINGVVNDKSVVRTSPSSDEAYQSWTMRGAGAGAWILDLGASNALENIRTSIGGLQSADTALDARIDALEIPSALDCNTATETWTTEAEADVSYSGGTCTIGLDGDTTQWPVGVSRPVNKVNTSANTIVLDPQPTHTINGVAAGTNVTLQNSSVVASATQAAGVWRIKRLSATAWWAQ
jgi:hypothetical protein